MVYWALSSQMVNGPIIIIIISFIFKGINLGLQVVKYFIYTKKKRKKSS